MPAVATVRSAVFAAMHCCSVLTSFKPVPLHAGSDVKCFCYACPVFNLTRIGLGALYDAGQCAGVPALHSSSLSQYIVHLLNSVHLLGRMRAFVHIC